MRIAAPLDDRTAASDLGYVLRAEPGFGDLHYVLPPGLAGIEEGTFDIYGENDELRFPFWDLDPEQDVVFTFEIAAVDRAGNIGPFSPSATIEDRGPFCACSVSAAGASGADAAGFAVLLVVVVVGVQRGRRTDRRLSSSRFRVEG